MSATPGKRVKKKAKTLTLSEFMGSGDTDASPLSTPQGQFSKARRDGDIILPQGPRASGRVEVDLSRLAPDPPYHLLISNMSYDADEPRLREHLGQSINRHSQSINRHSQSSLTVLIVSCYPMETIRED